MLRIVWIFFLSINVQGVINGVQTTIAGSRFAPIEPLIWGPFINSGTNVLIINASLTYQTIFGFGSALTESAAFNFASLSSTQRDALATLLWAPSPLGNGYTAGRMHMGSADFSLSTYSLDETLNDYSLQFFDDLLTHDHKYVIPLALAAINASNGALNLFASPWSPPSWLKINENMIDSAHPQGLIQSNEAFITYANYFVRFIKAMKQAGVNLWGVTLQNEPLIVMKPTGHRYEACSWTAESQAAWLHDYLGPAIRNDTITAHIKLLPYDYNKGELSAWASTLMNVAGEFVDGFSYHWYNWAGGLELNDLATLQDNYPGIFSIATEASIIMAGKASPLNVHDNHGTIHSSPKTSSTTLAPPIPGNNSVAYTYAVGELYALDLLGDILFGSSGWIDWNAFLNITGGPNHLGRSDIGAPILVDPFSDSFYVQSPYYYVGHISRYVPQGSKRISCLGEGIANTPIEHDAIKDFIKPQVSGLPAPDNIVDLIAGCFSINGTSSAIVIVNPNTKTSPFTLSLIETGTGLGSATTQLPPHSITTFTFDLF
jgi:glucosylceramidase